MFATIPLKVQLIMLLALLYLPSSVAVAASYAVSPLIIDRDLEARDIVTQTITLTNLSDQAVRVFPTVNAVTIGASGTVETFVEPSMIEDRASAITSWIELPRGRVELGPKETKEIPVTVRVHHEAPAGEYHAFIGFPEGGNRPEAERVVYTRSAPGTVLRIGIDQRQTEFLRLSKFAVDRFVTASKEGGIVYTLVNPGDAPVVPEGEIIFYDTRGQEVGALAVNEGGETVAPGKELTLSATLPSTLKLGKYKAFLSIEYGQENRTSINDTAFFYVLPLKQLILIFGSILLCAIVLALFLHRRFDDETLVPEVHDVPLYTRSSRSEPKDHDIDLSKKM